MRKEDKGNLQDVQPTGAAGLIGESLMHLAAGVIVLPIVVGLSILMTIGVFGLFLAAAFGLGGDNSFPGHSARNKSQASSVPKSA